MRFRCLLGSLAMALLAACGEEVPPARYDLFAVEIVELSEGDRVFPGQALSYRIRYEGDLVRNLRFDAVFTHEASGESVSTGWAENIQDTYRLDLRRSWTLRHAFLERSGRIRVRLRASLTATKKGSTPWVAESQSVHVELHPALDGVAVRSPAIDQPLAYGTELDFEVTGADLWSDVQVTVADADTGATIPGLEKALPFDGSQSAIAARWTIRARALELVGTRRLRLVARYGELEARSAPFAFVLTHTIDEVTILLRDPTGALGPPTAARPRLTEVTELGLRISGTLLAGHALTVNGGAPVVASGDRLDLLVLTPAFDDFADGHGSQGYGFIVRSGGIERSASVTLQRWGIESCGWRSSDGRPLAEGETLAQGTEVALHARLWGFPDTTTQLLFFKSPLAEFTIWERDPGGRPTPEQIDTLANNDDRGESFDADVRSDQTEARWTTVFDDELDPLDLHLTSAEYYFEVQVEDQLCTSGEIRVRSSEP